MAVLDLWATHDRFSSKVFQALSDGTRRQILHLLESEDRNAGEIATNFNLSQSTISRHLTILRNADLVTGERLGQQVIYSLNGETLTGSMQRFFGRFRGCQDALK